MSDERTGLSGPHVYTPDPVTGICETCCCGEWNHKEADRG